MSDFVDHFRESFRGDAAANAVEATSGDCAEPPGLAAQAPPAGPDLQSLIGEMRWHLSDLLEELSD